MSVIKFPELFLITKNGKEKVWKIWLEGNSFFRQDYFVGGKVKDPTKRECVETNSGKTNERTPEKQAEFEAARAWIKILDRGYKPKSENGIKLYEEILNIKREMGGTIHDLSIEFLKMLRGQYKNYSKDKISKELVFVKPMLASTYKSAIKHFDPTTSSWYSQAKLDGVRCIGQVFNGKTYLTTRTRKEFVHLTSIKKAVNELIEKATKKLKKNIILDGELYTHKLFIGEKYVTLSTKFNMISGACRPVRKLPADYEDQIQYHIFDIVDEKLTQEERFKDIEKLKSMTKSKYIVFVPYEKVENVKDLDIHHENYVKEGYEGAIMRKGDSKYRVSTTSSRPNFLFKYKTFQDDEFEIIGVKECSGTEKGCVKWICITKDGKEFDVRPRGTFEERKYLYDNKGNYMNKMLTVRYQELFDDGTPRMGVGVGIRDYE